MSGLAAIRSRTILVLSATLVISAAALPQTPGADLAPPTGHGPHGGGPGFGGPFGERMELLGIGGMHGKIVTGAPFSAAATAETKQTLADGTTIKRTIQTNLFRDAQGRVRREVTMPAFGPLAASGAPRTFIMIQDPVAGAEYMLDPSKKIAHQFPQHRKQAANASGNSPENDKHNPANDPNVIKESLGTQLINGVSAQGTRYTRTIAAGQIGNDKPLTIVKEEWYSPDLQINVQIKHSDPLMGETTYTVTNIQRAAPNAALFSIPSDYTITAESAGGPHRGPRGSGTPGSDGPGI
jgi:hypothetical protein